MKIIRWLGIVVGVGLALLVLLAGTLYAWFDGEKIKAQIAQAVKEKTRRELSIRGPVQLSLWPNVGVKLGHTALSEPASSRGFLAFDSARISVAVMPLLKKEIVVNALAADGVTATLVKRKDGTLNISDLMGGKDGKEEDKKVGAGDTADKSVQQLDISGIELTRAHLVWRDEQAGSTTTLNPLNIATGHVLFASQGQRLNVDKIAVKDVNLTRVDAPTGNTLALAGLSFSADRIALSGTANGLAIDALALDNKQFKQRDGKTGGTTALDTLKFSAAHVASNQAQQTLVADKVALTTRGKKGSNVFDVDFSAPQLTLTPSKVTGQAISLAGHLASGPRQTKVKLALSGVEGSLKDVRIARMVLDADSTSGKEALKVHLVSPINADLTAQLVSLQKIEGTLDLTHPALPMQRVNLPLAGSVQADWGKQRAAIRLATQLEASKIGFEAQIQNFSPLAMNFDLAIDQLNVDKYFPPKPAAAGATTSAPAQEGKEAPLGFAALNGLNLQGTVRIGALQTNNLKLKKLNARLKLSDGRLDMAPLSADLYEGSMNGSLMVNAKGNRIALQQTLSGVSVNPLLKDLANKDLLSGKGTVVADITGQGNTVSQLKKSLAGSASLVLRDGAIKGINLAQSLRDIKAKLGGKQDVTQAARSGEKTDFSELTASFRMLNGVAHNEDLAMKSPFLRLSGIGDIDVGNNQINYLAKARVVNTSSGQDGKSADQVKGITVPVRVTGPLDNISWKIEFAQALGDVIKEKTQARVEEKKQEIKQKVDEKKEELKQKAGDQLRDKLKGLFGK